MILFLFLKQRAGGFTVWYNEFMSLYKANITQLAAPYRSLSSLNSGFRGCDTQHLHMWHPPKLFYQGSAGLRRLGKSMQSGLMSNNVLFFWPRSRMSFSSVHATGKTICWLSRRVNLILYSSWQPHVLNLFLLVHFCLFLCVQLSSTALLWFVFILCTKPWVEFLSVVILKLFE